MKNEQGLGNQEGVQLVDARVRWKQPRYGCIKINVHGCFYVEPLPNGNRSGIGYVIRNYRGRVLRMVAVSLGINEERINEFYSMIMGLKRAYLEEYDDLILETDNAGAYWKWRFSVF